MPRQSSFQAKSLLLVFVVFLLWWFAPGFLKRWSGVVFHEFQAPAWTALGYLRDMRAYWALRQHSKSELIEAGIDLSRLNAAYALRNQQTDALEEEIRRLEAFFDLPSHPQFRYEVARVIRRDLSSWWQVLVIRKGLAHGIEPGQAVVFAGGVVGRVTAVNAYTAKVELISNPLFRTAARFEGHDTPVEFRGGLNPTLQAASGTVASVPANLTASLRDPLRLTSTSLGGSFPDGLTLGWVYRLEPAPDGLFQSGTVGLDPRLHSLREVAVLIPLAPREEETR